MKKPAKFAKAGNPKMRQRELQSSWEAVLAKHSKPLFGKPTKPVQLKTVVVESPRPNGDNQRKIPSNPNSMMGQATKVAPKIYTGTKIIGIATMHKSNMVPIFNEQAAIDVAQMRRS